MSFDLLSEPIRRYIRDKGWEELRAIQNAAISKILTTDDNYILVSKTASGKTEAAFLPILSKADFRKLGVQVLYIAPLVALINDQFSRVEDLCKYMDVRITKWHGEANLSAKDHLLRDPNGIVLITPESLEAMLALKLHNARLLFGNLNYVVVDEIHSFVGTDRGRQLMSILFRIQEFNSTPFIVIGLSATVSESKRFSEVKQFTGNEAKTKVLIDRTANDIRVEFRYFDGENTDGLPPALLHDLYEVTKDSKALIFPNSRSRTEEVAIKLKKISTRMNGHTNYFSHHSSVDQEVREYIEHFAKTNKRQNFCISCTSTLELGIDIGSVDKIVQIDATHSIASLIQRTGRSGRRNDEKSNLFLYATEPWSLLQSVAGWMLYKEGFIEPPVVSSRPYDILLHQILSIVKGNSGLTLDRLTKSLALNHAFAGITEAETADIIGHMIQTDLLEKIQGEVIIGVTGESIVNSRNFYSVFKTEDSFSVIHAGVTIGEIPLSLRIREGENIWLAARVWKIKYVDEKAKKIDVIEAAGGRSPNFPGQSGAVHDTIRRKMFSILMSRETFDFIDQNAAAELEKLRNDFSSLQIVKPETQRPVVMKDKAMRVFTFAGSEINSTLILLLDAMGIEASFDARKSMFEIYRSQQELRSIWKSMIDELQNVEDYLQNLIESQPAYMDFSKWAEYLAMKYQLALFKERKFDVEATAAFLKNTELVFADVTRS